MNDVSQPQALFKSMQAALEIAAKVIALAATVCIALSVLFDWGYLSALDLRLSEVPTSLSDHTRSAILWLPVAGFTFPPGFVFSLFSGELDARDAREAKDRGEDLSVYAAKEAKHARRNLAVMAVVSLFLWLAFGDRSRPFLFFAAIIAWTLVVVRVTPVTAGNWRLGYSLRFSLLLPPLLAGSLFLLGYNTGRAAIAPDQLFGTLSIRGGSGIEQMKGNIVRPFERFVIVIDEKRKVIVLKPDDIVRVEKAGYSSSNKGLLCEYWLFACPRPL
jgi:hypothetical protein